MSIDIIAAIKGMPVSFFGKGARSHFSKATAAFAVGYESASQFNREYRRSFGQPPIRDVRTLRSHSAALLEGVTNQNDS